MTKTKTSAGSGVPPPSGPSARARARERETREGTLALALALALALTSGLGDPLWGMPCSAVAVAAPIDVGLVWLVTGDAAPVAAAAAAATASPIRGLLLLREVEAARCCPPLRPRPGEGSSQCTWSLEHSEGAARGETTRGRPVVRDRAEAVAAAAAWRGGEAPAI